MTPRKEDKEEEGILERMLESLESIGQDVERIMYRAHFYSTGAGQSNDDEWSPEDLYDNAEY